MRVIFTIMLAIFIISAQAQTANQSILKGNEYYRLGQYEQAEKEYSAAVKADPANTTAKFNLAAAIYRMGKEPESIKNYEELTTVQNTSLKANAYYNKGSILSKQKKLEESIDVYKNALRNNPNDKEARENLQKALLELKKKEPPKKKDDDKKKKQERQQQKQRQPQPKLSQKEAEQRLKLLEEKEKELQQSIQKKKAQGGGSQNKDW